MDDDYDNYVPQISTMDYSLLQPGGSGSGAAGGAGTPASGGGGLPPQQHFMFEGVGGPVIPPGAARAGACLPPPGMPGAGGHPQFGHAGAEFGGAMPAQAYPPGYCMPPSMAPPPHMQLAAAAAAHRQQSMGCQPQFDPRYGGGIAIVPKMSSAAAAQMMAQQQSSVGTKAAKSSGKKGKKASAAAAAAAAAADAAGNSGAGSGSVTAVMDHGAGMMVGGGTGPQQVLSPAQYQQMGYYYKGPGPPPGMMPPGHTEMMSAAAHVRDEQQQKQNFQQAQQQQMFQQQQHYAQQQQPPQGIYTQQGTTTTAAGGQSHFGAGYGLQQHAKQSATTAAKSTTQQMMKGAPGTAGASAMDARGGGQSTATTQQYNQQQQPMFYNTAQLQQQQYLAQQQQSAGGQYSMMPSQTSAGYPPMQYPTPADYNQQMAMQRQAYYVQQQQQQMMAAAAAGGAGSGSTVVPSSVAGGGAGGSSVAPTAAFYHQNYMTQQQQHQQQQQQQQYVLQQQQQQLYRELYECDQQLNALLPRAQQNAEAGMRVEKLQMHRTYIQGHLMQLQQQAALIASSNVLQPPMSSASMVPMQQQLPAASSDVASPSSNAMSNREQPQQQFMGAQPAATGSVAQYGAPPPATYGTNAAQSQQQPHGHHFPGTVAGQPQQQPQHHHQQQQQSQQVAVAAQIPIQQKLQPSSNQPLAPQHPYGTTASGTTSAPSSYMPTTPQTVASTGFNSPAAGGTPQQHQQPASVGMVVPQQQQGTAVQQQQASGAPVQMAQHQGPPPQFTQQHLAPPSVAVMSASSQVQVNIRPEMPGRTLISVYHSQDMAPSVVSSSAAPVPSMQQHQTQQHQQPYVVSSTAADASMMAQNLAMAAAAAAKDSIPPEPVPSNIVQEQKRRQQLLLQQQQWDEEELQHEKQQRQQQQMLKHLQQQQSTNMALPTKTSSLSTTPPPPNAPISPAIRTRDDEAVQDAQQQRLRSSSAAQVAPLTFRHRSHTSAVPQPLQPEVAVEKSPHLQRKQTPPPSSLPSDWQQQQATTPPLAHSYPYQSSGGSVFGGNSSNKVPTPPPPVNVIRAPQPPPLPVVQNAKVAYHFVAKQSKPSFESCTTVRRIIVKETVVGTVKIIPRKVEVKMAAAEPVFDNAKCSTAVVYADDSSAGQAFGMNKIAASSPLPPASSSPPKSDIIREAETVSSSSAAKEIPKSTDIGSQMCYPEKMASQFEIDDDSGDGMGGNGDDNDDQRDVEMSGDDDEAKSVVEKMPDEVDKETGVNMEEETKTIIAEAEPMSALTPSASESCLNRLDDKEESAVDSSPWPEVSTKETTPMEAEEQQQPLTFSDKHTSCSTSTIATELTYAFAASGPSSSKGKQQRVGTKKRKLDWNRRDEDDDYVSRTKSVRRTMPVPSSSKKRSGGRKAGATASATAEMGMEEAFEEEGMSAMMAAEQLMLVEKRRSTRKVTGAKKAKYEGDSEDEAVDDAASASRVAASAATFQHQQQLQTVEFEEKIVEKILGVRIGKRKIMRKAKKKREEEEKEATKEEKESAKDKVEEKEKKEETSVMSEEQMETNTAGDVQLGEKEMKKETEEDKEEKKSEEKEQTEGEKKKEEDDDEEDQEEEVEVEELYAKYKNYSYLHCEWKTVEELEQLGDKRALAKLNRHKQKFGETTTVAGEDDEQEYFNEDYTVVARILDETYDDQEQQHYVFVKWKGLSYDECTWELLQNVPELKVEEFRQRLKFDPCKAREQSDVRLSAAEFGQLAVPKDKVYKNDNMLREYQHEGVNWLLWTWTNGRNCILADEMGLGKTVQSIAFLQSLYDIDIHGPFLVVVPLSTLSNWEREFENWTNINVIVYHGGALSRQIIQNYEFYYKKSDRRRITKFDAMITTYEVVVQEVEVLRKINFRVCVIDEAHRIKNRNCKLLQTGLLSLKMDYRVLLTGTPLQNNIQELFSLLNFLEPEQFANSEAFLHQFGQCQTEEQVQKLQEILKPMMLRRLKEDVEKELQPKEETIIEVQLSNIQKKYYRAVLERNFTHLMKGSTPSLISLNNTMMQLRKCCNHPYLINGAEEQIISELKQSHPDKTEEEIQVMALISSSGKLVLIDKLLPKLHADGHKVLIFSQMVRVLDLLEEYLTIKGYPFERIDGNIRGNDRQAAIDRFSRPHSYDRFVFLLCTRAGGLGINLTTADTVVLFDSDWNPQNDLQAQARCHRIGQTKPVKIYRLITANSYEREMFDKASLKLGLDKAVLQSMLHNNKGESTQQMSRQEVEDLLRKGAYGAIMDDNEGTKFSEEDIDTILLRRTQTIRLEPGVKGSTFAKASFTSSHNREDIDIQDPDFWSKWAKKAHIDVNSLNDEYSTKHLIVHEPRSRKKRFEADNFKGNSESGDDGCSDEDDRSQSTPGPGTSKIAEGVKNRSSKRRRRVGGPQGGAGEDDEDYPYKPDELAFNKTSYFKVEKLLAQFGWGRWAVLKAFSDLTEHELEHITRTLLLHCVREFRGEEKVREYVWTLITPSHGTQKTATKTEQQQEEKKTSVSSDSNSRYHQGWAALPEYNPPFICVDASFQRHLHRHSNKILNRIQQLHFLHTNIVTTPTTANSVAQTQSKVDTEPSQEKNDSTPPTVTANNGNSNGYEFKVELPEALDKWQIMPNWDRNCDRDLLIGVHKHGMENWEQVRVDEKLCFAQKNIQFPNTLDLNNRFKYLISVLQKTAEAAANPSNAPPEPPLVVEWTKVEESDFMRILRNYGVKDDTNSQNVINWSRFRELSICLHKKTDKELLEMLYCVLAMCTCVQSGREGLSALDEGRADRVEPINAKAAEKLMNRLHLMRKVHAIITMGIQNIRGMLKMVALDVMPKGWTEAHDEHLLIVVDKFGLEDIHGKVKLLPKLFESVGPIDEQILLRRVVEICITLETGKWSGPASIEMLQEDSVFQQQQQQQRVQPQQLQVPSTSGAVPAATTAVQQQQQSAGSNSAAKNLATAGKSAASAAGTGGRKKVDQPLTTARKGSVNQQQQQQQQLQNSSITDKSKLASTSGTSSSSGAGNKMPTMSYNDQQALLKMMEQMSSPNYLLSLMSLMSPTGPGGSGSSATASIQQQFQQLQALLSLSAMGAGSGTTACAGGAIVDPTLASLSASLAAALTGGTGGATAAASLSSTPSAGAGGGKAGGTSSSSSGTITGGSSGTSVITTAAVASSADSSVSKLDALNLSKRSGGASHEDNKPAATATTKATKTATTGTTTSASKAVSASKQQQQTTTAGIGTTSSSSTTKQHGPTGSRPTTDTLGSLSTGLSTSAINKLSQMSVPELLAYSNLSQDIRIPVVHIETGQRFDNDKAPTMKNLDQWLRANPKYNVDLLSLATSHPSLFSSSSVSTTSSATLSAANSGGSRISTPKGSSSSVFSHKHNATNESIQKSQKTPTNIGTGERNSVGASAVPFPAAPSVTQQLIEQAAKKSAASSSSTNAAAAAAGSSSSSFSTPSLFGLGGAGTDFQGGGTASTVAQQMAAINQLLSGLAPTGVSAQTASQLQATNLAAATALATSAAAAAASTNCANNSGTQQQQQQQSLKSIEQQMLLLQQTMALGGLGSSSGGTASSVLNPYASFLYQNPADLFDISKSGQHSAFGTGASASSSASALLSAATPQHQQQHASSSSSAMEQQAIAALAAAAVAAGFPPIGHMMPTASPSATVVGSGGTTKSSGGGTGSTAAAASSSAADLNALSSAAAALSSADLYLAAMAASSFQSFLGGGGASGNAAVAAGANPAAMPNNIFMLNHQQQQQHLQAASASAATTPSAATAAALSSSSSASSASMNAALEQLFQAAGMDASALMMGLGGAAAPKLATAAARTVTPSQQHHHHNQQKSVVPTNLRHPPVSSATTIATASSASAVVAGRAGGTTPTKTVLTKVESAKTISLPLVTTTTTADSVTSQLQHQQQRTSESPARKLGMGPVGGGSSCKGLKLNAVLEKLNASSSSTSTSAASTTNSSIGSAMTPVTTATTTTPTTVTMLPSASSESSTTIEPPAPPANSTELMQQHIAATVGDGGGGGDVQEETTLVQKPIDNDDNGDHQNEPEPKQVEASANVQTVKEAADTAVPEMVATPKATTDVHFDAKLEEQEEDAQTKLVVASDDDEENAEEGTSVACDREKKG